MTRRAIVAALLAPAVGCTACGGGSPGADHRAAAVSAPSQFAHGVPTQPKQRRIPPPPGSLAGLAQQSISIVVSVHDLGAAARQDLGLPSGALRAQSRDVRRRIRQLQVQIRRDSGHRRRSRALTAVLGDYAALLEPLTRPRPRIAPGVSRQLDRADARWRASMRALSHGVQLPQLLEPASRAGSPASRPGA